MCIRRGSGQAVSPRHPGSLVHPLKCFAITRRRNPRPRAGSRDGDHLHDRDGAVACNRFESRGNTFTLNIQIHFSSKTPTRTSAPAGSYNTGASTHRRDKWSTIRAEVESLGDARCTRDGDDPNTWANSWAGGTRLGEGPAIAQGKIGTIAGHVESFLSVCRPNRYEWCQEKRSDVAERRAQRALPKFHHDGAKGQNSSSRSLGKKCQDRTRKLLIQPTLRQ